MFAGIRPRQKAEAPFVSVEEALEEIRRGRMIILMDDEDRENEGDLCMAAEKVTPEAINFMATHGRGLICLAMTPERIDRLGLTMMVANNRAPLGTAFTTSITWRQCTGSGVSARDRALTIFHAVREDATGADFFTPGYVYPLRARSGGVLVRTGQTEGSVDLARLAGLKPAGVICEILNEDGTMARRPELIKFAKQHRLKILTVADIVEYRLRSETLVRRIASCTLPTCWGEFRAHAYQNILDGSEHMVLVKGEIDPSRPVLVRAHREYLPGDVFAYQERNTRRLLNAAMKRINESGRGVVLYLRRETGTITPEAGNGLPTRNNPVSTHFSPDRPDFRDYGIGAQILRDVGVRQMILLTDSPLRLVSLPGYGLEIVASVPLTENSPPQA